MQILVIKPKSLISVMMIKAFNFQQITKECFISA